MLQYKDNIAALIGSRICHDLISPIGAVTNGLELMTLSGAAQTPEMVLVAESASNANARICLFRLAFGVASDQQMTGSDEIRRILRGVYADSRITVDWQPNGDIPRQMAQAALLALLCADSAVGLGGTISVAEENDRWTVLAAGDRIKTDPDLWAGLADPMTAADVVPADVQFLLLPDHLARLGRNCRYQLSDDRVVLEF